MIDLSEVLSPTEMATVKPKFRTLTREERAIAEAQKQKKQIHAAAQATKAKVLNFCKLCNWKTWEEAEKDTGFTFLDIWKSKPYSDALLNQAMDLYVSSAVEVFLNQQASYTATNVLIDTGRVFGERTLRPRQYKCLKLMVNGIEQKRSGAFYAPLPTGAGKTLIAACLFNYAQNNWKDRIHRIPFGRFMFITKKAVLEKTRREFVKCGVTGIGTDVNIISYPQLSSAKFGDRFEECEVTILGNIVKSFKYLATPPAIVVLDEGQVVKKLSSLAAKKILAIIESCPETIFIWTSATPAVCMQDLQLFCISTRVRWMGQPLSRETWPAFVSQFTSDPKVADDYAARKFHEYIGEDVWIRPPADKRKYKIKNSVEIIQMTDPRDIKAYGNAEANYIEALRRAGKDIDERGMVMAKFIILRTCEEVIKAKDFARRGLEKYRNGFSPLVAVCYQQTVCEVVLHWTKAGVLRSNICVIWGGKRQPKPDELLSDNEFVSILVRKSNKEEISKEELRKFKITADFREQRLRRDETMEEQASREAELRALGLTKPSDKQQQLEIDEFNAGKRQFCIYTFGRGGTGIDLDDQLGPPFCRPRSTDSTICYYGEEFVQAGGRTAREATVTDVEFIMLFYAGTIAANHVAPILVPKLRNIQALAAGSVDLASVLENRIADEVAAEEVTSTSAEQEGDEILLVDDGEDTDDENAEEKE